MTLSTQTNTKEYTANGVTTVFAYDFPILSEDHMKVYLDGVLQSSGYTVDGVGSASGGNVTFASAPASSVRVSLYREVPLTQEVDYQPYDPFPAETHETALDKLTMLVQQVYERTLRAISAPIGSDPTVDYTLPQYDAGKAIMWDAVTKELTNSDDNVNGILSASLAAQAAAEVAQAAAELAQAAAELAQTGAETAETNAGLSETAAGVSETNAGISETNAGISETNAGVSETNAANSETNAGVSETNASNSEAKAEKWAEELEDVEVETGKYSSLHHAAKAAASAVTAATYAVQKFTSTSAPTSGDGSDGDLWFQYTA